MVLDFRLSFLPCICCLAKQNRSFFDLEFLSWSLKHLFKTKEITKSRLPTLQNVGGGLCYDDVGYLATQKRLFFDLDFERGLLNSVFCFFNKKTKSGLPTLQKTAMVFFVMYFGAWRRKNVLPSPCILSVVS